MSKKQKRSRDHCILLCWEKAVTPSQNGYRLKEIIPIALSHLQEGKPTNGLEIPHGVRFQDSVLDTASLLHLFYFALSFGPDSPASRFDLFQCCLPMLVLFPLR